MSYIDVSVVAVPTAKKAAYVAHAKEFAKFITELGAQKVVDAWGDDVPDGKMTDFKRAVQSKSDETVAVGWVRWPDKKTRDTAWEKMSADPRMKNMEMPFDGKRMIFGGFGEIPLN